MTVVPVRAGAVLTCTIDSPGTRNAIDRDIAAALTAAIRAAPDSGVRAIVLRGAGGAFSSGGNLRLMPPPDADAADARLRTYAELLRAITRAPLPVIAAVEGACAGIAVGIAAASDVVIAESRAAFLLPHTRLGLFPDGGVLHTLAARVGPARAKRLLLAGETIGADAALAMGLADAVVAGEDFEARLGEEVAALAARAPLAVAAIKRAFADGVGGLDDVLETERREQLRLYWTADFAEGRQAFFDRRAPGFTGR